MHFIGLAAQKAIFLSYYFLTTLLLQKVETPTQISLVLQTIDFWKIDLSWFLKMNNIHTIRSLLRLLVVALFFQAVCIASPTPFQLSSKFDMLRAQGVSEVNLNVPALMDMANIFRQSEIPSTLNIRYPSPAIMVSDTTYVLDKDGELSPCALWRLHGEESRPKWMFSWL